MINDLEDIQLSKKKSKVSFLPPEKHALCTLMEEAVSIKCIYVTCECKRHSAWEAR